MAPRILYQLLLCCVSCICHSQHRPHPVPYTDGTKWGYADTTGKVVIPLQWPEARFFADGKAMVVVHKDPGNPHRNIYALIDGAGRYIISPQQGWSGGWAGSWAGSGSNAADSQGKAGIIDLSGNVLLPFEWDAVVPMAPPMSDSFKIVYRNGLAGIINRRGELVVPLKWGHIHSTEELARIKAFMVTDPDNMDGRNKLGVEDLQNRLIIPPRYQEISTVRLSDRKVVFKVSSSSNNEPVHIYQSPSDNATTIRYLEFPSGHVVPAPPVMEQDGGQYVYHLPGGRIVYDHIKGLMDSNGKVIVPIARFWRMKGDTVLLRDEKRVGKDSVAFTITYLNVHTLRPVAAPRALILYRKDEVKNPRGYEYTGRFDLNRRETPTIPIPDYGNVEQFYKDSFLYSVQGYAEERQQKYFIVYGNTLSGQTSGRNTFYAVVDSNLNYAILPQTGFRIISYHPDDQLAIAEGYSERYGAQGYSLLNSEGRELMRPQRGQITAAFSWNGMAYAYVRIQDECDINKVTIVLTDTSATPLPAFTKLNVAQHHSTYRSGPILPPHGSVWALDSAGRIGVLFPDGKAVYPRLNFRYQRITPTYNGWFMVHEAGRPSRMVDTGNRQIPAGLMVQTIEPARKPDNPYHTSSYIPVPRMYSIFATNGEGKGVNCYLDDTGQAYYTAP